MTRLGAVLAVALVPCGAWGQGCPQFFPGGRAPALVNARLGQRTALLCNDGYAVLASGITKGALWSAEHLTRAGVGAARQLQREGEFHAEERLPEGERAELEDYRRSGFDRGHMAPSGDMPTAEAQQQSFSLANMVPQAGELNRGVWAGIEMGVRRLAERDGEIFVVTGPAFQGRQLQSIGANGVLVPSATWKAVYDPRAGGSGAYMCTNVDQAQCSTMTVSALVQAVGIDPFPGVAAQVKAVLMALPEPEAPGPRRGRRGRGGWLDQ